MKVYNAIIVVLQFPLACIVAAAGLAWWWLEFRKHDDDGAPVDEQFWTLH